MTTALDNVIHLDAVLEAVLAKLVPLAAETAGYLLLDLAGACAHEHLALEPAAVVVGEEGVVAVVQATESNEPTTEACLRSILGRLLAAGGSSTPALHAAAERVAEGQRDLFVTEIEAALIPLNRGAGRRAVARLAREARRVSLGIGRHGALTTPEKLHRPSTPPPPAVHPVGALAPMAPMAPPEALEVPTSDAPRPDALGNLPRVEPLAPPPAAVAAVSEMGPPRPPPRIDISELPEPAPAERPSTTSEVPEAPRDAPVALVETPAAPPGFASEALHTRERLAPAEGLAADSPAPLHPANILAVAQDSVGAGDGAEPVGPNSGALSLRFPGIDGSEPSGEIFFDPRRQTARLVTERVVSSVQNTRWTRWRWPAFGALVVLCAGVLLGLKVAGRGEGTGSDAVVSAFRAGVRGVQSPCEATLTVEGIPPGAELFRRMGTSPLDVAHLPAGARLEWVAMAEGFRVRRAVIPAGAPWNHGGQGARYELAIQLDAKPPSGMDPWPSAEPGPQVGGAGNPGVVHVVTSPPGAEIFFFSGVSPAATMASLACDEAYELLLAGPRDERRRLVVGSGEFVKTTEGTTGIEGRAAHVQLNDR